MNIFLCFLFSLQQEAFAKNNLTIIPGSKLVLLSDLKNCLYQLKCLLVEREKLKEKHCDIGPSELPLSKRWCGSARECWAWHHSFLHWQISWEKILTLSSMCDLATKSFIESHYLLSFICSIIAFCLSQWQMCLCETHLVF